MLCYFAQTFPQYAAQLMSVEDRLSRNVREETITDLIVANICLWGGPSVYVDYPDEPQTGADMEWVFIDRFTGSYVRVLLQAKRVFGKGQNWLRHSYKHLNHKVGSTGTYQAEVLLNAIRTNSYTVGLYAFYHPERTIEAARESGVNLGGVNLAFAVPVARKVLSAERAKLWGGLRGIKHHYPGFFSLSDLFCPGTVVPVRIQAYAGAHPGRPLLFGVSKGKAKFGIPTAPDPFEISNRIGRILDSQLDDFSDDDKELLRRPIIGELPPEIVKRKLHERKYFRFGDEVPRAQVVLVSDTSSD